MLDFLNVFFFAEMIYKIISLGIGTYIKDTFNILDTIINITTFVELILSNVITTYSFSYFRIFRIMSLLRVLNTL